MPPAHRPLATPRVPREKPRIRYVGGLSESDAAGVVAALAFLLVVCARVFVPADAPRPDFNGRVVSVRPEIRFERAGEVMERIRDGRLASQLRELRWETSIGDARAKALLENGEIEAQVHDPKGRLCFNDLLELEACDPNWLGRDDARTLVPALFQFLHHGAAATNERIEEIALPRVFAALATLTPDWRETPEGREMIRGHRESATLRIQSFNMQEKYNGVIPVGLPGYKVVARFGYWTADRSLSVLELIAPDVANSVRVENARLEQLARLWTERSLTNVMRANVIIDQALPGRRTGVRARDLDNF